MKLKSKVLVAMFLIAVFGSATRTCAQTFAGLSGISGDGFPDVFYDPSSGVFSLDTDGIDIVAVFIGGADVSTSGCNLCDGMNLPGIDALANASTWTVGFSAGSTQWIRTNPLQGRGFTGRLADDFIDGNGDTQPWPADVPPFLDFPDAGGGIANYGPGASFDAVFTGPNGLNWEVTFATDDGATYLTSTSLVPPNLFPVTMADSYLTTIGGTIDSTLDMLPGLLDNDFDPEGVLLEASLGNTSPMHGSVTIDSDGSFVYTHDGSGNLTDTFTYFASDFVNFAEETVTITIVPESTLRGLGSAWIILLAARSRRRIR